MSDKTEGTQFPVKNKKTIIHVAFAVNDEYVDHLNVAIYSLLKNNQKHQIKIYIMCEALTKRNKAQIIRIQDYYKNADTRFLELNSQISKFNKLELKIEHISKETYYRYILADLLPELDRVIYLDADILITGELYDLYTADIDGFYIAGVDESDNPKRFPGHKEKIGLKSDGLYANAGVLLMNLDKIRRDKMVDKLFQNTIEFGENILFQDQDILNITFKDKIKQLPNIWNYTDQDKQEGSQKMSDLKIIHYNGPDKPWSNTEPADFQEIFVKKYDRCVDEYNELLYGSKNKFALYKYTTENIGDEVQSIAARRFLPRVDYYIDRDKVGDWQNSKTETVKLITNGWYSHAPYSWPITNKTVDPLYISMYVEQSSPAEDKFISAESRRVFQKYGKIGARDKNTLELFKENKIMAYFSGCLTLTLQKDKRVKKEDFILLVDTSRDIYDLVRSKTKRPIVYLTQYSLFSLSTKQKMRSAELRLYLCQAAHCVITSRLHTALPCLAFETPVLFITAGDCVNESDLRNRSRGLSELTRTASDEMYLNMYDIFDVDNPPKNSNKYKKIRDDLIKICEEFTGYNNSESAYWTDIAEADLSDIIAEVNFNESQNLKSTGVFALQHHWEKEYLQGLQRRVDSLEIELQSHLGIKRSARLMAGNIKRRIQNGKKTTKA
jgi:lipopolysaccharide biosynthesis glycosyltransferase